MSPARFQPRGKRNALSRRGRARSCDVADRLPAEAHQQVDRPDVEVLVPVPGPRRLGRGEAGERNLRDVVVVPVHVRIRVVRNVVLDAPGIAREAEQRVGRPADEVVPATAAEVGAVVRVVLDAERDQRRTDQQAGEGEQSTGDARVTEDEEPHETAISPTAIGAFA